MAGWNSSLFPFGFSYWIPTGNEVDLKCGDFIDYFAGHDDTGVIAAYIEGFKNGGRLKHAADHADRRRVGREETGSRNAGFAGILTAWITPTFQLACADSARKGTTTTWRS